MKKAKETKFRTVYGEKHVGIFTFHSINRPFYFFKLFSKINGEKFPFFIKK
ncbi:hypothetical protein B4065_3230 [Caldibacillus thermoamylovorans]|uniref:Uncharacterized protein n=1 Tax=Caldibacillus thermoamylovorans TaxID=35841 RepID=A0ABD4ABV8_9BACI|nr:hypothetical protein B4166_3575 [Caldibacillus thermoamylovorans]KIO62301.1 hypothetical protein B4065_3230 [Caldibacillus thermoamylovorans]KIO73845.1 hypothetical protein B4167_1792 [Caldibacillus thermoamylovorans]